MPLDLIAGWNITSPDPIDTRHIVTQSSDRFGFNEARIHYGLATFESESQEYFILVNTASYTNVNGWSKVYISNPGGEGLNVVGSITASGVISGDSLDIANIEATGDILGTNITASSNISASGYISASNAVITSLTDNRIVIVGPGGKLEDDTNLTFNGTELNIGASKFTVQQGSGDTQIVGTLDVDAQSTLASVNVQDLTDNRIVIAGTSGELEDDSKLTFDGNTLRTEASFLVTGSITASGDVSASGNLLANGISASGDLSASGFFYDASYPDPSLSVDGDITGSNLLATNYISASGDYFINPLKAIKSTANPTNTRIYLGPLADTWQIYAGGVYHEFSPTATVFNQGGVDNDFKIESNLFGEAFKINAGDDILSTNIKNVLIKSTINTFITGSETQLQSTNTALVSGSQVRLQGAEVVVSSTGQGTTTTRPILHIQNQDSEIAVNNEVGKIQFSDFDSALSGSVQILAKATEDHDNTNNSGTRLEIWTTPTGSETPKLNAYFGRGQSHPDYAADNFISGNMSIIIPDDNSGAEIFSNQLRIGSPRFPSTFYFNPGTNYFASPFIRTRYIDASSFYDAAAYPNNAINLASSYGPLNDGILHTTSDSFEFKPYKNFYIELNDNGGSSSALFEIYDENITDDQPVTRINTIRTGTYKHSLVQSGSIFTSKSLFLDNRYEDQTLGYRDADNVLRRALYFEASGSTKIGANTTILANRAPSGSVVIAPAISDGGGDREMARFDHHNRQITFTSGSVTIENGSSVGDSGQEPILYLKYASTYVGNNEIFGQIRFTSTDSQPSDNYAAVLSMQAQREFNSSNAHTKFRFDTFAGADPTIPFQVSPKQGCLIQRPSLTKGEVEVAGSNNILLTLKAGNSEDQNESDSASTTGGSSLLQFREKSLSGWSNYIDIMDKGLMINNSFNRAVSGYSDAGHRIPLIVSGSVASTTNNNNHGHAPLMFIQGDCGYVYPGSSPADRAYKSSLLELRYKDHDDVGNNNDSWPDYFENTGDRYLDYIQFTTQIPSDPAETVVERSRIIGGFYLRNDGQQITDYGISDKRLKKNIKDTEQGINDLLKMRVRDFHWKNQKENREPSTGFIAQELYEHFPQKGYVRKGGDDPNTAPWGITLKDMIPLIVKSIQDQQKMIEDLQAEIKELKSKL